MTTLTRRVGIVRRAGRAPESRAGLELFGSLLDAPEHARVRRSVAALGSNEVHADSHSEDLAAGITRGRLRLSVGPDFLAPIELRAGDYFLVPRGVAHRMVAFEEGAEMVVARLAPLGHTLQAPASASIRPR